MNSVHLIGNLATDVELRDVARGKEGRELPARRRPRQPRRRRGLRLGLRVGPPGRALRRVPREGQPRRRSTAACKSRTWEQDGKRRDAVEVVARRVEFLSRPNREPREAEVMPFEAVERLRRAATRASRGTRARRASRRRGARRSRGGRSRRSRGAARAAAARTPSRPAAAPSCPARPRGRGTGTSTRSRSERGVARDERLAGGERVGVLRRAGEERLGHRRVEAGRVGDAPPAEGERPPERASARRACAGARRAVPAGRCRAA